MRIEPVTIDLNGHELLLRSPEEQDASILIAYLIQIAKETPFLTHEPEEITMTVEKEMDFIRKMNESNTGCMIMGFYDGEFAGNCSIHGEQKPRLKHRATIGIALMEQFTEKRIGTTIMKTLIEVGKKMGLEQLELEVVQGNERARNLYQRMGFSIYGVFPNAQKYKDGSYRDCYWMMKSLKEKQ